MASRSLWKSLKAAPTRRLVLNETSYRCFSCSRRTQTDSKPEKDRMTHFGFTNVPEDKKESMVGAVFSSVASSYDTMNDLMSLGIHRLWKDHFVRSLNPGSPLPSRDTDPAKRGWNILDIAGGTGDIAFRMLDHATNINHDNDTRVTIADINAEMLAEGKKRSIETPYYNSERLSFMQGNAEHMPSIPDNSVDLYTVVFGIRNFTDKQAALVEAYRVLKPGGVFACMEFSKVDNPLFSTIYKQWNFTAIPMIGQLVAGDRDSYQYLVESIEKFPSQEEFRGMIQKAGFMIPGRGFENLTGGIAAIHKGIKPLPFLRSPPLGEDWASLFIFFENAIVTMGHLKHKPRIPSLSAMPTSGASIQGGFVGLPLTPPEPAHGVLPGPKDPASVSTVIHVISTERAALAHLERLYQTDQLAQEHLSRAVDQIARTVRHGGKLVLCGVGKSGKISQKLEATMNSLGIYSTFLHPTEALHGDLGMVRPNDTLLLISFSGRTPELLLLLPHIPPTVRVIALTSHTHPSTCPLLSFQPSDMGILLPAPIHEDEETSMGVCAPTSSTTVALALGDALAIATARKLHITPGRGPAEVFKSHHPGGAIGAASTASTPLSMSMSSASFTSNPSDYLPASVRQPIPLSSSEQIDAEIEEYRRDRDRDQDEDQDQENPPPPDSIANLINVKLDQIPTVSTSTTNNKMRLLDVLLTAIQHLNAKSWVFVSPDVLIAPSKLRFLSQGYVDMDVFSLGDLGSPYLVPRDHWTFVTDELTIQEARGEFDPDPDGANAVLAVVRGQDFEHVIGLLEIGDLFEGVE
ncbi:ubiE/COQ5 methyltransferase family-domain-containing protein [Aspergillus undulatus]|uniref:ubiE/COQ5 methyltransferase family-domain-containing protein n=1 Tax=Aspergillus undulatus TaxID=1810928 RepID=UPI003CCDF4B3